jgi:purine-binding chemotaxis protein CheW
MNDGTMGAATEQLANELSEGKRDASELGGKYLTFFLGGEEYGIEILKVQEIIGMMSITSVPRTPHFILGLINLRGKVIPIVDLRLKFAMPSVEQTEETCMIVVQAAGVIMGIVVDRVSEVMDIATQSIDDAPNFGTEVNTDYILGIGKAGDRIILLLDIENVLTTQEVIDITEMANEATYNASASSETARQSSEPAETDQAAGSAAVDEDTGNEPGDN